MDKQAYNICLRWAQEVSQALARYEGVPANRVRLQMSSENLWRLMNWKSWSIRYTVTLDFILTTLLSYYKKIRYKRTDRIDLGISVAALTGPRAQEILEQAVAASYPDQENIAAHLSDTRNRILSRRLQKFSNETTVAENLQQYRKNLLEQQHRSSLLPKQFTRPWRGNPFNGSGKDGI